MELTPETVRVERDRVLAAADVVVPLIADVREDLGGVFGVEVDPVSTEQYRSEVEVVFADGDRAVNVAALAAVLRDLDVADDYPGFVVDEQLGRLLAGTIAGGQPLGTLAEATFHYADLLSHGGPEDDAGADDLHAALAAGFQTRLPGWEWRESPSPFVVE